MDHELTAALARSGQGRLQFDEESRCLSYLAHDQSRIRIIASVAEIRGLMQLLVMLEDQPPSSVPTLDVATGALLRHLDRFPVHASRGLAHVRAAALRERPHLVPDGSPSPRSRTLGVAS